MDDNNLVMPDKSTGIPLLRLPPARQPDGQDTSRCRRYLSSATLQPHSCMLPVTDSTSDVIPYVRKADSRKRKHGLPEVSPGSKCRAVLAADVVPPA